MLKSRTFSKHKVSAIKDWVHRQLCAAAAPVHPALPQLIEVYVNSVLVPAVSNRGVTDQTNEPISEAEVRAVFRRPAAVAPVMPAGAASAVKSVSPKVEAKAAAKPARRGGSRSELSDVIFRTNCFWIVLNNSKHGRLH